jgi:hypothetical protein
METQIETLSILKKKDKKKAGVANTVVLKNQITGKKER